MSADGRLGRSLGGLGVLVEEDWMARVRSCGGWLMIKRSNECGEAGEEEVDEDILSCGGMLWKGKWRKLSPESDRGQCSTQ